MSCADDVKATDEYKALGVIGRQRLLFQECPELEETYKAESAAHIEEVVYPQGTFSEEEEDVT
jgi:hypothetical protein